MIKMVNIDVDGTLLNSKGELTENIKQSFRKAKEKGVEIVITTGRPTKSSITISEESGASKYVIAGNGALIYDREKEEVIFNNYFTQEKILEIINICEENSIFYNVYTEEEILARTLEYNILFYHKENVYKEPEKRSDINIVHNIRDYIISNNIQNFLKITICDKSKVVFNNIKQKLEKVNDIEVLDTAWMSRKIIKDGTQELAIEYYYTEISPQNGNKWTAVNKLAELLSINNEEIMTIGDNMNDLLMIEKAGFGVAMGNSAPSLKEVAKFVTEDNENDGVALAINKYVLEVDN